jgi:hypothetical protein
MPENDFRIHFERSGGLAGLALKATVDSASLAPDDAAQLAALVDNVRQSASQVAPRGADRFQYDIRVERGGKVHTITAHDGSMSPEVKALTEKLMPFARPA